MKEKKRGRLGIKIFLQTFFVLIFMLSIGFFVIGMVLPDFYRTAFKEDFAEMFTELGMIVSRELMVEPLESVGDLIDNFASENNAWITLKELDGDILFQTDHLVSRMDSDQFELPSFSGWNRQTGQGFTIEAVVSLAIVDHLLELLYQLYVYLFMGFLLFSAVFAFWNSRTLAAPIVELSLRSKRMSQLDLKRDKVILRNDEIGELSDNLNQMAEKLEGALTDLQAEMERERRLEQERKQLFTAISHDLKTPVTVLKGELRGMIDGVGDYVDRDTYLRSAYETVGKLEGLIQEVLTISRMEASDFKLQMHEVDLERLVENICLEHETLAMRRQVAFTYFCQQGERVLADEVQLKSAISNIINNAVFHSRVGEMVDVQLTDCKIRVENTGNQIPEKDLTRIFEPFYRSEQSRNRHSGGSGLGLYIVKHILDMHGFEYGIWNEEDSVVFEVNFTKSLPNENH